MIAKKIMAGLLVISTLAHLTCSAQASTLFQPIAVVELFTSEGCSSCPPADKLLAATLKNEYPGGQKVFGLAFHVDYWNRLGWRDSFSTKQFSGRQAMYVAGLGLNGAYTPQMVVNGTTEFVGSDKSSLNKALLQALHTKSTTAFSALKATFHNNSLSVSYALKGDISNSRVNVALVLIHAATAVKAGENRGLKLEHTNIVNQFVSAKAQPNGTLELEHIPATEQSNLMVIAYVQQNAGLQITGAACVEPGR